VRILKIRHEDGGEPLIWLYMQEGADGLLLARVADVARSSTVETKSPPTNINARGGLRRDGSSQKFAHLNGQTLDGVRPRLRAPPEDLRALISAVRGV
jgi:hypothetical protein